MSNKINSIQDYITSFPEETQAKLQMIHQAIIKLAPDASESISYGLPTYKINNKPLIYFGGYKNHIGLYALPSSHAKFEKLLDGYKKGKGSVQFPLTEPLPIDLISRIVEFRVQELSSKPSRF